MWDTTWVSFRVNVFPSRGSGVLREANYELILRGFGSSPKDRTVATSFLLHCYTLEQMRQEF